MLNSIRTVSLAVIFLFHVYPGHVEGRSYDLVKMIEGIGSHITAAQSLKRTENTTLVVSILDELNKYIDLVFPNGTLNPALVELEKDIYDNKCLLDIFHTLQSTKRREMWAISLVDAFAKPSAGILDGNFKWLGDYHECRNVRSPPKGNTSIGNFQAQYCGLPVEVNVTVMVLPLQVGLCVPESCVANGTLVQLDPDLVEFLANLTDLIPYLEQITSAVTLKPATCHPKEKKLTTPAIAMICFISFFLLLAFTASSITAYGYFIKVFQRKEVECVYADSKARQINGDIETHPNGSLSDVAFLPIGEDESRINVCWKNCKEFLNCFCIFTNGGKLLNTDSAEGQLPCLHGIRFLSMSWVIVCHAYAFSFTSVGNIIEMLTIIDSWLFQVILNGFFSVDSFFLLSGFLVAYLYFQESAKPNGKVPWLYFYVHRYIRLTPIYMICIGFYAVLFYYIGSGPLWQTIPIDPMCQKHWWWNILYINNFQDSGTMCLGWSWYLANDMQFFVISPLFLITLWRWPKIGYSLLGLFLTASFATNFGLTYHYDLFSGLGNISKLGTDMMTFIARWGSFFDKIYTKPYTRISPYLVGIALAYYLFKRKQNNQGKISWIAVAAGWVIAASTTLTCLFVLYDRKLTTIENSFYNATNRTVFALGLAWVIFTCIIGQGGFINSILSYKLFIPLSRLTYTAYLIHPMVLFLYFNGSKVPVQFDHLTLVVSYLGMLIITYAFSFIVSLVFESPIIRLEKVLRTKLKS